jgi:hypothetical protein
VEADDFLAVEGGVLAVEALEVLDDFVEVFIKTLDLPVTAHSLLVVLLQLRANLPQLFLQVFNLVATLPLLHSPQFLRQSSQALQSHPAVASLFCSLCQTIAGIERVDVGLYHCHEALSFETQRRHAIEAFPKLYHLLQELWRLLNGQRGGLHEAVAVATRKSLPQRLYRPLRQRICSYQLVFHVLALSYACPHLVDKGGVEVPQDPMKLTTAFAKLTRYDHNFFELAEADSVDGADGVVE